MARDINTIFNSDWTTATGSVVKPTFINKRYISAKVYKRVVEEERIRKIEEAMGIIERTRYTPESHIGWRVTIVSSTQTDAEDLINECRRICAAFIPTATERQLIWEGGDWSNPKAWRFEFTFVVFVRISGMSIG